MELYELILCVISFSKGINSIDKLKLQTIFFFEAQKLSQSEYDDILAKLEEKRQEILTSYIEDGNEVIVI